VSPFCWTGDLFSALILAWSHHAESTLSEAVHKATASLQAVCRRTFEACDGNPKPSFRERELQLVASKVDLQTCFSVSGTSLDWVTEGHRTPGHHNGRADLVAMTVKRRYGRVQLF
jgi:hypothetical protein